jgi:hypothetical protein
MKTFTININNEAAVLGGDVAVPEGGITFASGQEFAKISGDWPAARLVEIWNKLPGAKPIQRFTDRKTAVRRIWSAIEKLKPGVQPDTDPPAPASAAKRESKAKTTAKSKSKPEPAGSKTEQVLAALRDPSGVTLKQLVKLTGWQPHSVRGFLSAQVSKRMGFRIKSFKRGGERTYKIRG